MAKKIKDITVKPYKRNGKLVKGYKRARRKASGKRRYSKEEYKVTRVYDPMTGQLLGTRWSKIKKKK